MLVILCILLYLVEASNATVYVSLHFDDTYDFHYNISLQLQSYGIAGTFYANSGRVNQVGRLTLQQLQNMSSAGFEIGGHTTTHANLSTCDFATQEEEICADRVQWLAWGFPVVSFAYPFGAPTNVSYGIVTNCGYNSARDSGGLQSDASCTVCPTGEFVPPENPYLMRSVSYSEVLGIVGIQWYINQAIVEASNLTLDRWVMVVFHEWGQPSAFPNSTTVVTPSDFTSFLNWLVTQPVTLRTTRDLVGGAVAPVFLDVPSATPPSLHIVLTFDGGTIDHLNAAMNMTALDMPGTFFVSSNNVGLAGYLTKGNLQAMQGMGHEIGSKGESGLSLANNSAAQSELCGSRQYLQNISLQITSLAWPFGSTSSQLQSTAQTVCGYRTARGVGGIRSLPNYFGGSCGSCQYSDSLPPPNAFALNAYSVKSNVTLGYLIWQVRQAEQTNGSTQRALIFIFSSICQGCAFSPTIFEDFLGWLQPRNVIGTIVNSLNQLI